MPEVGDIGKNLNILRQFRKDADLNKDDHLSRDEIAMTLIKMPKYIAAFLGLIMGIISLVQVVYSLVAEVDINWMVLLTTLFILAGAIIIYLIVKTNAESSIKTTNLISNDHNTIITKLNLYISQLEKAVDFFKDEGQGFKGTLGLYKFIFNFIKENNPDVKLPTIEEF